MEETNKNSTISDSEIRCIDKESTEYPRKLKNYRGMPEKLYCRIQYNNSEIK